MTAADVLEQYWGYDSFRECQAEIIDSVLSGRDTIGLMPTGGGKSVTFQVPAMMLDGVTLVVTPLISLMKDQVDNLRRRGIPAACLHSGLTRHETRVTLDRLFLGKIKLLYLAPERLVREEFIASISTLAVSLIVVDEAHCISQWGYDFRPSYLRISALRQSFPDVPVLALTASATPAVVDDIAARLEMRSPARFSRSFARDNISYVVRRCEVKDDMMLHVLRNTAGAAIVYVRSRRRTVLIAQTLKDNGISADFYHAGIEPQEKAARQDAWMQGRVRVIVATTAFGMGIDKPDVRLVIHYDVPMSLEEYYQEAGRAGRDGLPSYAVLLASTPDKGVMKRRLGDLFPPRAYIRDVYDRMCVFLNVAVGEGYNRLYECNLFAFCKMHELEPRKVASALGILTRAGVMEFGEELGARARLMIVIDRRDFYDMTFSPDAEKVIQAVMRLYTGLFADFVPIDELRIAYATSLTADRVYQALLELSRMHVVQYVPRRLLPYIYFPTSRELSRHILIPREVYEDQLERATRRMEAMRDYVFDDSTCRVGRMLRYFGDTKAGDCGKCDVCRERNKANNRRARLESISSSVDSLLASAGELSLQRIVELFPGQADEVIDYLRRLVDERRADYDGMVFRRR